MGSCSLTMVVKAVRRILPRSRKHPALRIYESAPARILQIPRVCYDKVIAQAVQLSPHEACGFLSTRDNQVTSVCPVPNVHADPINHYLMNPAACAETLSEILGTGDSYAIYHSHPVANAELSAEDFDYAVPGVLQLVVGLGQGPILRAWMLGQTGTFQILIQVVE